MSDDSLGDIEYDGPLEAPPARAVPAAVPGRLVPLPGPTAQNWLAARAKMAQEARQRVLAELRQRAEQSRQRGTTGRL